jgi:hypothetical protein
MSTRIQARSTYNRRKVPDQYDAGFFTDELQTLQRSLTPFTTRAVAADATAIATDDLILVDATTGPVSITLPDAERTQNAHFTIKKTDASANAVTIVAAVDGGTNPVLATQWESLTVQSYGTLYFKLASV